MKKHFFNVLTALVFSSLFIFFSCNSSSPSSDGELGFTIPDSLVQSIVKKSREGGYGTYGFDTDVKFVVSLNGSGGTNKTDTKTLFEAMLAHEYNDETGAITFKFTDLNVSETYKITVKAYLVEGEREFLAYEGVAENIKISSGEQKVVKILLQETTDYLNSISTYIILYNNTNERFGLYAFAPDFLEKGSQAEPLYQNSTSFLDFAINEDNTLYWTDGNYIYANYQNDPIGAFDWISSGLSGPESENIHIYSDCSGVLFAGGQVNSWYQFLITAYDSNQGCDFPAASVNLADVLGYGWEIKKVFDFATDLELVEMNDPNIIAEYDGYLYLAFSYTYNNKAYIALAQVPISVSIERNNGESTQNSIYVSDTALNGEPSPIKLISFYDVAYSNGEINTFVASLTNNAAITDMIVHNGNLYALLREVNVQKSQYYDNPEMALTYETYSRGALVKICEPEKDNNFISANVQLLGDALCINPWTFDNGQEGNSLRTWNFYQPSKNGYFYGPQKFIGIKPKELVIADDGLFFWEEDGAYKFKNINMAIIYNEKTNAVNEYTISSSLPILFDEEEFDDIKYIGVSDTTAAQTYLTVIKTE